MLNSSCLSIAERTGTANGMATGTATRMANGGYGNRGDGNRDGDGRWRWHCDGVSVKCEGWCWASPLSEWCRKHNIGRYGSVSWWCNGLTVLLFVTVYYGDITLYYCDSRQFPSMPKRWWSLAKWLPMTVSPFSNTPYYPWYGDYCDDPDPIITVTQTVTCNLALIFFTQWLILIFGFFSSSRI
jgi:hypothetical protein